LVSGRLARERQLLHPLRVRLRATAWHFVKLRLIEAIGIGRR
jgi:hypothetical protein